jgi:hypothetical protein
MRWMRSTGPATAASRNVVSTEGRRRWRRIPLGCLLAGALLAGLPAAACATTTEMRGEWELAENFGTEHTHARALIREEANAKGEFASNSLLFEGIVSGVFSGTLEGSNATVTVITQPFGPIPASMFTSSTMKVESSGGSPSLSGSGTFSSAGYKLPATLTATRIKTYKEVEEREAKEKQEQEEREARLNVLGEWELSLSSLAGTVKGTALISQAANTKNEFASAGALFEAAIPGSFAGTLEGAKATVTVTTQAYGPFPASEFTSTTMTVKSSGGSMSMTGSGTGTFGPATLTATRIKTYKQLTEESEAKEKLEREAREKQEREAREKQEREASEQRAREAALKSGAPTMQGGGNQGGVTLVSAAPTAKTFTVGGSGSLSLELTNPNGLSVKGHLTLAMGGAGKASLAKSKTKAISLGAASFAISAHAHKIVKIKLSNGSYATLVRRKKLHVVLSVSTSAAGEPTVKKTYNITLTLSSPTSRKH